MHVTIVACHHACTSSIACNFCHSAMTYVYIHVRHNCSSWFNQVALSAVPFGMCCCHGNCWLHVIWVVTNGWSSVSCGTDEITSLIRLPYTASELTTLHVRDTLWSYCSIITVQYTALHDTDTVAIAGVRQRKQINILGLCSGDTYVCVLPCLGCMVATFINR